MAGFKKFIGGLIIGVLLGLWFGFNIGQDRPLWSNPFSEPSLQERAKEKAGQVIEDTKESVRKQLE